MNAPIPQNETERLNALRRYALLDTPAEEAFDRVTRLVARLLKVPIALVSLVDKDRQWFKSAHGIAERETSRELSFCAHTILSDEVFEIPDTTQDFRFLDNELVTGAMHIRFYAGVPLQSPDGLKLGSLCAIDTEPRELSDVEREILTDLAAIVSDELALRLAMRERSQQAAAMFHLNGGVIISDPNQPDNPNIYSNPGFWRMTHYLPEEILGRNCRFLQGPETDPFVLEEIRAAIKGQRTFHGELLNYRKDGTAFWNELTISPVFDGAGKLMNFIGLQRDVTERKRQADVLKQSFAKLQELEALRDNLTNMIIHDLRSPFELCDRIP